MGERAARIALALLAVNGFVLGIWAGFAPQSFYDDFPGGGRTWVSVDGPYNEHLVRDVGVYSLGLAVVTLLAALRATRRGLRAVAIGWFVVFVPHLVYHARHLDVYETSDKVSSIASLALGAVLPLVALAATFRSEHREARTPVP